MAWRGGRVEGGDAGKGQRESLDTDQIGRGRERLIGAGGPVEDR